jgi:hypothetical protein
VTADQRETDGAEDHCGSTRQPIRTSRPDHTEEIALTDLALDSRFSFVAVATKARLRVDVAPRD